MTRVKFREIGGAKVSLNIPEAQSQGMLESSLLNESLAGDKGRPMVVVGFAALSGYYTASFMSIGAVLM